MPMERKRTGRAAAAVVHDVDVYRELRNWRRQLLTLHTCVTLARRNQRGGGEILIKRMASLLFDFKDEKRKMERKTLEISTPTHYAIAPAAAARNWRN